MSERALPDSMLRLMSKEDRQSIGQSTASEAQQKWKKREEKKMHQTFEQDLIRRKWPYIHSRMDKPSTIRKGWPDFTVMHAGKVVCIELKALGGVLSEDQRQCIAELRCDNTPVMVTEDIGEAIRFAVDHLGTL